MQILADLERDLHIFGKRRGNVLGEQILVRVGSGEQLEIGRHGSEGRFDGDAEASEGFAKRDLGKTAGLRNGVGEQNGRRTEGHVAGDGDDVSAVGISDVGGNVEVDTFDATGAPADLPFFLLVAC